MKSLSLACFCTILLSTMMLAQSNPVPLINNPLVPDAISPGGASFTLTVNGTGFVSGAVVNWNHRPLTTAFVSSSQLTATVPASDIATASIADVTVGNPAPGGGTSNVDFFEIRRPFTAVSFGQSSFATSTSPQIPLVADLNDDGKLDVVNTDYAFGNNSPTVSVLLGNGDGTFQAHVDYPLAAFGGVVAVGDFNNDGKLDLAVTTDGYSILLGNGDGTFQPAQDFPIASYIAGVAAGDFNADGNLDLAFNVVYPGTQVLVVLGNGNGTFQSPVTYDVSSSGSLGFVATADFNGDGKLDLVLPINSAIAVMLGNGDGTFGAPVNYATAPGTATLVAADFNGDGKLDVATQNISSPTSAVSILLGNGDGTFQGHVDYPVPIRSSPFSIAAADLNGDGKLDLVLGTEGNAGMFTLLGKGNGGFQSAGYFAASTASFLFGGAVGDFNGDGMPDLVSADDGDNEIAVLPQVTAVLSRTVITFGSVKVGSSASTTSTVSNIGSNALSIRKVTVTGRSKSNFSETNDCGRTLAPGASCTITAVFAPLNAGKNAANITVSDSAVNTLQTIYLQGTGTN